MADFKSLIGNGSLKLGTYVGEFASPGLGQIIGSTGCDFAFVDMEHSGFTFETAKALLRSFHDAGLATVLRPPSQVLHHLSRACDIGAQGIVPPMLGTVVQAKACIEAVKYPPMGKRGAAFTIAHDDYRPRLVTESIAYGNARTSFVALIETAEGVQNCEAIAAVDNVDCLWIGHMDLSISLGVPGEFRSPAFVSAVSKVMAAAKSAGKAVGRMVASPEEGKQLFQEGCEFICYSGDVWLFRQALQSGVSATRKAIAELENGRKS